EARRLSVNAPGDPASRGGHDEGRAVGRDGDRAVELRAPNPGSGGGEGGERRGVRVPEPVAPAGGDDRLARGHGSEERGGRRRAAPVVAHFEDVGAEAGRVEAEQIR